ncbi:DoxX family protein [Puia sp. P3]|uniref:DoxX family protein n=1 Tax=Puia sp. P3 TaxID=3423952 RepID=UPI003D6679EC
MNTLFSIAGKNCRQLAPLLLRLAMGFGFMAHGWAKLSRGPESFAKLLSLLHVPAPHLMAWLTTATELLGGFALLIGAFVGITAIPLIATMLVAMFTIHIHFGYSTIRTIGLTPEGPVFGPPGYEINLLYIAGLLSLILTGAGRFSVDGLLGKNRRI